MIPASFDYVRAESPDHAVQLLREHGDEAKLLAGGHSLLPLMKLRLATPSVLVDVNDVGDQSEIRLDGDELREHVPLLRAAAERVGDPQVRHRGTLAGSLAHGDPASDLPAACLALGATFIARGAGGERQIPADAFFRGFLETALGPDELLTEIRVPKQPQTRWGWQKLTRRAQDWAIVGVAAVMNGTPRVALVNMDDHPVRARAVEDALAGGAAPRDAAQRAADGVSPPTDLNGDAEYRSHLARVLVQRALEGAG